MMRHSPARGQAPSRVLAYSIRMSRRLRLWVPTTSTQMRRRRGGLCGKSLRARLGDSLVVFHVIAAANKERVMKQTTLQLTAVLLAMACAVLPASKPASAQSAPPVASELSGLANVSGTVTSASPFKAARVYFRTVDKRSQYMGYTADGRYPRS